MLILQGSTNKPVQCRNAASRSAARLNLKSVAGPRREPSPSTSCRSPGASVIVPTCMIIKCKSHSKRLITFLTAPFDNVLYYLIKTQHFVFIEDYRVSTSSITQKQTQLKRGLCFVCFIEAKWNRRI